MKLEELKALIEENVGAQVAAAIADTLKNFKAPATNNAGGIFGAALGGQPTVKSEDASLNIGRMVRSLAAFKSGGVRPAEYAARMWGADSGVAKALGATDSVAGGYLVPDQWSAEVIEFLRPQTVVRALGPVMMPMDEGTMNVPRINNGGAAAYIGENSALNVTQQAFGNVPLSWKKLSALVPVSNDLLRSKSAGADAIIRDDVVRAMAQAEDLAFIRGLGTQFSPKGLRYWAKTTSATAGTSTANMITDLSTAILNLRNANVRFIKPAWIMSPRTEQSLMTAQNAQGFYVFRAEMLTGKLWGFPYKTTTQIPINLSGSQTELYLCDFADAVIGEASELLIDASSEAAYVDGSATVQAAYSLDQTVVRAIARHDFVMRHDESVTVITGVAY